jgi:hypothetical protein
MKLLKVTIILSGLAALPWLVCWYRSKRIAHKNCEEKRYDINDYVADQGL